MPSREADFKRREVKICSYKKKGGGGDTGMWGEGMHYIYFYHSIF